MLNSRHTRRTVLAGIGRTATFLALPNVARGKAAKPTKRLAMVRQSEKAVNLRASAALRFRVFFDVLAEQGYIEDDNLVVFRFSDGQPRPSNAEAPDGSGARALSRLYQPEIRRGPLGQSSP
jgi:hypothetical protein